MPGTIQEIPRRTRIVYLPKMPELREVMARPGIGPGELARRLGRNRSMVNDILLGRRNQKEIAFEIAKFFGRPVEDLFFIIDLEDPEISDWPSFHRNCVASV